MDGAARSLAVEDGCQASDRPPADKYRLGAERVLVALVECCDARGLAGRDLLRQLAFAYLIGNGDAHLKNFSVVQALDGEWRVSPLYDSPSSQPYGDTTMGLSIGGRSGGDFGAADFLALAATLGVPQRAARRALTDLVDRADLWLPGLPDLPFDRGRIAKQQRVITYRCRASRPDLILGPEPRPGNAGRARGRAGRRR